MSNLSIYLPTYLSTCLSIYLPIYLSIYLDLSNIYICKNITYIIELSGFCPWSACEHRATFPALRVDDLLRCFFLWRANAGGENPMVYVIAITKTTYNL